MFNLESWKRIINNNKKVVESKKKEWIEIKLRINDIEKKRKIEDCSNKVKS